MLDMNKEIKKIMIDEDIRALDVANIMGISKQKFHYEMKSSNFNKKLNILESLGYEIELKIKKKN